jgi:adenosylcobinamide-GDP ribazoletransferase
MIAAVSFLTIVGRGRTPDGRAVRWFPLVGALIGAVEGGAWWLADRLLPAGPAAVVVVAVDLAVTGMLHLDGLADTADGLLPHLDRARRLAVMSAPDIGAFGMGAVVLVLLGRASALGSQPVVPLLLVALLAASRSAMAFVLGTQPYARDEGLASSFLGDRWVTPLAAAGVVTAGAVGALAAGWRGAAAVAALLLAAAAVVALARRRVGGFTGDIVGAAGLVGETAGLLVAAGRW